MWSGMHPPPDIMYKGDKVAKATASRSINASAKLLSPCPGEGKPRYGMVASKGFDPESTGRRKALSEVRGNSSLRKVEARDYSAGQSQIPMCKTPCPISCHHRSHHKHWVASLPTLLDNFALHLGGKHCFPLVRPMKCKMFILQGLLGYRFGEIASLVLLQVLEVKDGQRLLLVIQESSV